MKSSESNSIHDALKQIMDALKSHKLSYGSNSFGIPISIRLSNLVNQVREYVGEQAESARIIEKIKQANQEFKRQYLETKPEESPENQNSILSNP